MPQRPQRVNFIAENSVGTGPIKTATGAAYTFALEDINRFLLLDRATGITATVPPNSAVAFPINSIINFEQAGAGVVTLAAGAGVTINSAGGNLLTNGQFAVGSLIKTGTNTWTAAGNLTT